MRTVTSEANSLILLSTKNNAPAEMKTTNGACDFSSVVLVCTYMLSRSDYNFIKQGGECVPAGPEPIPEGQCRTSDTSQTFMGSSGYRLIPGNTCDASRGIKKDDPKEKSCSQGMLNFLLWVGYG